MTEIQFDANIRKDIKVYLERLLITGCKHQGKKNDRIKTMSKYIRFAVINQLIKDEYPLNGFTDKFDPFYKALNNIKINKGITVYK